MPLLENSYMRTYSIISYIDSLYNSKIMYTENVLYVVTVTYLSSEAYWIPRLELTHQTTYIPLKKRDREDSEGERINVYHNAHKWIRQLECARGLHIMG